MKVVVVTSLLIAVLQVISADECGKGCRCVCDGTGREGAGRYGADVNKQYGQGGPPGMG